MPSSDRDAVGAVAAAHGAPVALPVAAPAARDAPVAPAAKRASPQAGAGWGLRQMHPAYFAMAMATGIVSVACYLVGFRTPAVGLFWLNVVVYATLWVLTVLRL